MEKYQEIVTQIAKNHNLNPYLILAIIDVESSFETNAVRYEPHWKWFRTPEKFSRILKITTETEKQMQKFSYGLMQVMGAVAREYNFDQHLFKLCRPELGIEFGCIHLGKYLRKYKDLEMALAAYNGGPGAIESNGRFKNQRYVDKVLERFDRKYA